MEFPLEATAASLCCDRHAAAREALRFAWADGRVETLTFGDVAAASKALAEALKAAGVVEGARIALILPQCPLAGPLHIALARLRAIAVPLSPLFGPDGLAPRLGASGASLAIVHASRAADVREAAPRLPTWIVEGRAEERPPVVLRAAPSAVPAWVSGRGLGERPLCIIFTSGTTAEPKGAVLPERILAGRMAGFLGAHPGFGQEGDRFWSPADWAWIGGLHDALLAPWAAGVGVFAYQRIGGFDPARASALLAAHDVANAFLPPTALRLWMRAGVAAPGLRTLHTAGEPLSPLVHAWAAKAFGAPPREVYGLTECAFLAVNRDAEPGVTGEPAPGIALRLVGPEGEPGELAVRQGAPTMMLGYLSGDGLRLPLDGEGWLRTGDLARIDPRGRVTVLGRLDDVVKTGGYRVAPREVEEVLLYHPAVEECAVVGVPDEVRGAVLEAHVIAAPGAPPGDGLARELAAFVRTRLAVHEVPHRFHFVTELPKTTSGKVQRRRLRR
jgi:acetyl-CoA synthetase